MVLPDILQRSFFGNTIESYLVSCAVFAGALLFIVIFRCFLVARMKKITASSRIVLHETLFPGIQSNVIPLTIIAAFYASVHGLTMNESVRNIIHITVTIVMVFFAVRFLLTAVTFVIERRWKHGSQGRPLKAMQAGIQAVIWGTALIVLLDNLGVKISTLIAGLGIGGIAVALASQAMLGDIFAYFMVLLDRPFDTGDFIIVDEFMGTIEHIGVKSTRIRSLDGELLVFRNTDLTGSRIRNYKKMEQRRVHFTFGVTYKTSLDHLKKIPVLISSVISSIPNSRFDRAHFKAFGDYSLVYEVVYYVLSPDYNLHMDIQQEINFRIREEFDKQGVEFAFPTSTIYLEGTKGQSKFT